MNAQTDVYGILGHPVGHSMSPAIHNSAFKKIGYNACYVAFDVTDVKHAVAGVRALGIKGCSVTIPHKVTCMPLMDEIDPTAKAIGSMNTIVNEKGKLIGYNTDGRGALLALQAVTTLRGKRIAVIGSGGAARAIAMTLAMNTPIKSLTLAGVVRTELSRLKNNVRKVASCSVQNVLLKGKPDAHFLLDVDVLIHCTPVGMHPHSNQALFTKTDFLQKIIVFDAVYNPLMTRLLREAREAGCTVVQGVEMFINQAVAQFELWTGKKAPVELMRRTVLRELKKK